MCYSSTYSKVFSYTNERHFPQCDSTSKASDLQLNRYMKSCSSSGIMGMSVEFISSHLLSLEWTGSWPGCHVPTRSPRSQPFWPRTCWLLPGIFRCSSYIGSVCFRTSWTPANKNIVKTSVFQHCVPSNPMHTNHDRQFKIHNS